MRSNSILEIRNANIGDVEVLQGLYKFIKSLDIDLIKKMGEERFFEILKTCYESEKDRYSYKNCRVIVDDNRVIGFYFSYDYDFMIKSKSFWEESIVLNNNLDITDVIFEYNEMFEGEYYLDILYVFEQYRSQGYGNNLLKDFFSKEYTVKSLNVAEENSIARKLYESFGMKKESEIIIANHKYYHMVNCLR